MNLSTFSVCALPVLNVIIKVDVLCLVEASGTDSPCVSVWDSMLLFFLNMHNDDTLPTVAGLLLFLLNCFAHVRLKKTLMCYVLVVLHLPKKINPWFTVL